MNIKDVNQLNETNFTIKFGNIVENYTKIATKLYTKIPFKNRNEFINQTHVIIDNLPITEKETILKLHPDLAGRLADERKLTEESTEEQKAAGLDQLTPEYKNELNQLNTKYKQKFGFPFVVCARENKSDTILTGIRSRLGNDKQQELITGMNEVKKICKLRIENIIRN